MAITPGKAFGNYEITGTLGKGGMGEVYRAKDLKLGREVAIKTLPSSLASDKDRLARFEREAKLLASLNHGHIASVYGLDEQDGTLYIAMELVEGESLEERIKRGPVPVEDALRLGLQIAEALEAAHAKGVVHRDLKPANVMVTPDGVVKVLDFGLAKAFSGDPSEATAAHSPALSLAMTQQGLVLGTAGYMSPEQASGQATDQRADVWSFGVVVYEMLTGQPMFSGESVPHILADVLRADPNWKSLPTPMHPRVQQMLERCLEKRPRNRYAGIADARRDIEVALRDPAGLTVAPAASLAAAAAATPLPRRLLPWAAGIVLAVAAGAAAWTLKPAPPAQPPIYAEDPVPEGQTWAVPMLPVIDITDDGRQFAFNTTDAIHLRSMGSFETVQIPGVSETHVMPEFSPDGQSMAFITTGELVGGVSQIELVRIPTVGGSVRPLGIIGDANNVPLGISWSSDDSIVYGAAGGGVWRISANGGMPERIVETAEGEAVASAEILPGGEWVLFSLGQISATGVAWDTADIVMQSLRTGERRQIYSGGSSARYVPSGHIVFAFGSTLYALPFDVDRLEVTGSPVPVVDNVYRQPGTGMAQYAFSANGTLIYVPGNVTASSSESLVIGTRDGDLSRVPMPGGTYSAPRISPDGRWVAYTATYADGDDITVFELGAGGAPRRLTFGGVSRMPIWSRDGVRVFYQSTRDGAPGLYAQLADGTGGDPVRLTTPVEGESHAPETVSGDGQWLLYTRTDATSQDIWILDLATGETQALIAPPNTMVSQPVFSPDGNWLAYQSTETGSIEIFVQPFPLTGAKYQLPKAAQNHHPVWSVDGSELYYFPGIASWEAVAVTTEPRFSFGPVETLPNPPMNAAPQARRQYDTLPDGSGFIGTVGVAVGFTDQRESIRIVQNWFDELRRLAPVD